MIATHYDCNRGSLRRVVWFKKSNLQLMKQLFNLQEIDKVARSFAVAVQGKTVVAFHGEMGAGKTTFIGALCRALGTRDITGSPTFSIINQYLTGTGNIIYHMDWYRIRDEDEAVNAGVEDALFSGHLCLVEWPERAAGLLPDDTFHVALAAIDEQVRELSVPEY